VTSKQKQVLVRILKREAKGRAFWAENVHFATLRALKAHNMIRVSDSGLCYLTDAGRLIAIEESNA
jgi:hypothetical protein